MMNPNIQIVPTTIESLRSKYKSDSPRPFENRNKKQENKYDSGKNDEKDVTTIELLSATTNVTNCEESLEDSNDDDEEKEEEDIEEKNKKTRACRSNDFRTLIRSYAPEINYETSEKYVNTEKKEILFYLKREYPQETFDEELTLQELRFELEKRRTLDSEKEHVEFMKSILLLVLNGIEFLNSKMKILQLDGWAQSVSKNLKSHEKVLRILHVRYFKKTMSDPIAELGWTLVGSMILFHFMNKNKKNNSSASETEVEHDKDSNQSSTIPKLNPDNIGNILRMASQFL